MKVTLRLSEKVDVNGRSEVLLSTQVKIGGRVVRMRAKSEVRVKRELFSAERGVDLSRRRVVSAEEREWCVKMQERLNGILSTVAQAEIGADRSLMGCDWLRGVVQGYLHPERVEDVPTGVVSGSFSTLTRLYLDKGGFIPSYVRQFKVMVRSVLRFEGYVRATDRRRCDFVFDVQRVDNRVIDEYLGYLSRERELAAENVALFKRLMGSYPDWLKGGRDVINARGWNAIAKYVHQLRAFFHWLLLTGRTKSRPFEGVKLESEQYGTPFYITTEERDRIAAAVMPSEELERVRDVFVFQCYVGCRYGDLVRLTRENIVDGVLTYAPHKTKDDGGQVRLARVPLHRVARALIEKYEGVDERGRLMPVVANGGYNRGIREVFRIAGVMRNVVVRNGLTGENEIRPINEVASSHLARRTFIGNAYKIVADPNIIGKMSGHVEGSKAFARYRNIEDETLRDVIDRL